MAFVVAVTGGIACGKTAATDFFAAHGIPVLDADVYARAMTSSKGIALSAIAKEFGSFYIGPNGLDRPRMRNLVFSQPQARMRLEAIIHPLVRRAMQQDIEQCKKPWLVSALPLLSPHSPWLTFCSRVLVIDAPQYLQIARLAHRSGLSAQEALAIIQAQTSRLSRLQLADDIVENDSDLNTLYRCLTKLQELYSQLAATSKTTPI